MFSSPSKMTISISYSIPICMQTHSHILHMSKTSIRQLLKANPDTIVKDGYYSQIRILQSKTDTIVKSGYYSQRRILQSKTDTIVKDGYYSQRRILQSKTNTIVTDGYYSQRQISTLLQNSPRTIWWWCSIASCVHSYFLDLQHGFSMGHESDTAVYSFIHSFVSDPSSFLSLAFSDKKPSWGMGLDR